MEQSGIEMGSSTRVMRVPTVSPPIIVMAMEPYIGSFTSGIMPTMVVREAISTGRTRETVASTTA